MHEDYRDTWRAVDSLPNGNSPESEMYFRNAFLSILCWIPDTVSTFLLSSLLRRDGCRLPGAGGLPRFHPRSFRRLFDAPVFETGVEFRTGPVANLGSTPVGARDPRQLSKRDRSQTTRTRASMVDPTWFRVRHVPPFARVASPLLYLCSIRTASRHYNIIDSSVYFSARFVVVSSQEAGEFGWPQSRNPCLVLAHRFQISRTPVVPARNVAGGVSRTLSRRRNHRRDDASRGCPSSRAAHDGGTKEKNLKRGVDVTGIIRAT